MAEKPIEFSLTEAELEARIEAFMRRKFGDATREWPSQEVISRVCFDGVSTAQVGRYLKGQNWGQLARLAKFARWLGVSTDELLGLKDFQPQTTKPISHRQETLARDLIELTEVSSVLESFEYIIGACKRDKEVQVGGPPGKGEQFLQGVAKAEKLHREERAALDDKLNREAEARRAAMGERAENDSESTGGNEGSVGPIRKGPSAKSRDRQPTSGSKGSDKKGKV